MEQDIPLNREYFDAFSTAQLKRDIAFYRSSKYNTDRYLFLFENELERRIRNESNEK